MFKKILVPIEIQRPAVSAKLLKVAGDLAEQFKSAVHVTTVIPGYGMPIVASYFPADAKATVKREVQGQLKSFVSTHLKTKATVSVGEGKRAEEILKTAKRRRVDLILIGSTVGKVEGAILGSVGTKVAQRAECSVMVVRL